MANFSASRRQEAPRHDRRRDDGLPRRRSTRPTATSTRPSSILRIKGAAKAAKRGAEREATAGLVATLRRRAGRAQVRDRLRRQERGLRRRRPADRRRRVRGQGRPTSRPLKAVQLGDETVGEVVEGLAITIGEKIELGRVAYFDGPVVAYLHKRAADLPPAVGVLVEYDGDADAARGAAMQIAAMRPQYLTRDEVPADVVEQGARDRRGDLARGGQARAGDRQDHRGPAQRLLQGRRPARAAVGHREQEAVKAVLDEAGTTVKRFARFEVGA